MYEFPSQLSSPIHLKEKIVWKRERDKAKEREWESLSEKLRVKPIWNITSLAFLNVMHNNQDANTALSLKEGEARLLTPSAED